MKSETRRYLILLLALLFGAAGDSDALHDG